MQTVKTLKIKLSIIFAITILFSILLLVATSTQVNAATNTVNILIKNEPVQFTEQTGKPFIDSNNRTLVPMRVVMEKYGCTVDWEQESFSAIVKKGDIVVKVPTKQQFLFVNGSRVDTDTVPQVINGRTYLPVAVVLRAVGADVQWDNNSRSVVVDGVGQGANPVNTAPTVQPTQPAQPITVNTNTSTTIPTNSPVGYDEFMSNFEIIRVTKPNELGIGSMVVRNTQLNSEQLENLFLSTIENDLKKYVEHIILSNTQIQGEESYDLIFYSNTMKPESKELWVTFSSSRIMRATIKFHGGIPQNTTWIYNDWRKPLPPQSISH